jgi:dephospho-CoA kinase
MNKKIALTGGIATGKTTVAKRLSELGAIILDADVYARRVVEPGTPSWNSLREFLGPDYFKPDGTLKRRELREKIIEDPKCRSKLNDVLHPFILRAMWEDWETQRRLHPDIPIIFDIPLLFEGGFDKDFDLIILVYAAPEVQVERLIARDGLDRETAERTLSMQYPIESKRSLSDYVIDNGWDLGHTVGQIEELWEDLLGSK